MPFEDRSNDYNFKRLDSQARTKVMVEEAKKENVSEAHKKLFCAYEKQSIINKQDSVEKKTEEVSNITINDPQEPLGEVKEEVLPEEIAAAEELPQEKPDEIKEVNFDNVINDDQIKVDAGLIEKEIKKATPQPKKSYSFRIKLVAGVYCILVALFGGWVISNAVNISKTSDALYETTQQTQEISSDIVGILAKIKQADTIAGSPDGDSLVTEIITKEIEITPETITEPNEYKKSSNWFDVVIDFITGIFGG